MTPTEINRLDFDQIRRDWSPGIAETLIEAAIARKAEEVAAQHKARQNSIAQLRANRHFHDFGRDRCCNNCRMSQRDYFGQRHDLGDNPCHGEQHDSE